MLSVLLMYVTGTFRSLCGGGCPVVPLVNVIESTGDHILLHLLRSIATIRIHLLRKYCLQLVKESTRIRHIL